MLEQSQLLKELRLLREHIAQLESEIKTIVERAREGQILRSMGIGPVMAASIMAAVGHNENFPDAGTLKSYFGWAPIREQTGTTFDRSHLPHGGTRMMRQMMVLIVATVIRQETEWAHLYERLVQKNCPYDERRRERTGKIRVMGRVAGQMIETMYDPALHRRHRERHYISLRFASDHGEKVKGALW